MPGRSLGRAGTPAAVDVHDPTVPQLHKVVHGLPYALALGGVHAVDAGLGHPASDRDGDRTVPEGVEVRVEGQLVRVAGRPGREASAEGRGTAS